MKELRTLAGNASFSLFQKYLPLVFLAAGFALAFPLLALGELYRMKFVQGVGFVIMLLTLLSSIFTAREVAIRMQQDKSLLFLDALTHTLYRYLTFLCFLPILGFALQRFLEEKPSRDPFPGDEK